MKLLFQIGDHRTLFGYGFVLNQLTNTVLIGHPCISEERNMFVAENFNSLFDIYNMV